MVEDSYSMGEDSVKRLMLSLKELAAKRSVERKGSPLTRQEVEQHMQSLPGWNSKNGSIEKEFRFKSYLEGLAFANEIGQIAERENHHPDILIKWRRVKLTLSTHSVEGLSENDFILAAKSELKYQESKPD
jgi:4a-hydroxytetrahydrobiopterin dehydratase